jgi:predicted AlkP superfamily phosphohydrolase/phosphomutase
MNVVQRNKGTFFVLGIDAATWTVVKPNLGKLRNFKRLIEVGKSKTITLREKPISASVWCGMFSGKLPEEHKHESYVVNGEIVKREDIKVDFIWDVGLPTNEKEWEEELERVTEKTKFLMEEKPDLLISVYTCLDRIQHFHWGEDYVVEWYQRMDDKIGELIFDTGFLDANEDNKLIIISDHGFCSFGEAKVQTLPEHTKEGKLNLKGDHHENALLITVNVDYEIERPQDVFFAIREELR